MSAVLPAPVTARFHVSDLVARGMLILAGLGLALFLLAPMAATPKVPPTMRLMVRIPLATPALEGSTAFIPAVLMGDITSPIPSPSSASVARMLPMLAPTGRRDSRNRAMVITPVPTMGKIL